MTRVLARSRIGEQPQVTISLVTYDGMQWLPRCITTIFKQEFTSWELLVLDNASRDGTREWLEELLSREARFSLNVSPVNLGFARAHNVNIARANGEFVLLLNQDVELDERFLSNAVAAFSEPRVGAVQARLRCLELGGRRSDVLDSTGLSVGRDRRVVARGQGERDIGNFEAGQVFGADGPAPLYRRASLRDARVPKRGGGTEILDEDFFMYKEDVDLAWRLRLLGWDTVYVPSALAWHGRGAGSGGSVSAWASAMSNRKLPRWVTWLSWRNQRLMQVKCELPSMVLRDLPWLIRREVLSLGFIVATDPRRMVALLSLVQLLPTAMRKRRVIMARRRVTARELRRWLAP